MRNKQLGFSLVELLVVISIIGILSAVLYANFSQGSAQARDAERSADLRNVQSALELYKNKNGRYPAGCRPVGSWSGQTGSAYPCPSGNQYIVGLAPEFLPTLPVDSKLNGSNSGYVYATNANGTVYKFMALATVESEVVTYDHEFKSCDVDTTVNQRPCNQVQTILGTPSHSAGSRPQKCLATNATFRTSYGVWGGFAIPTVSPSNPNYVIQTERQTEFVICAAP